MASMAHREMRQCALRLGYETIEPCTAGPDQYIYQYHAIKLRGQGKSSFFKIIETQSRKHLS